MSTIAITGATGYLGGVVSTHLIGRGHHVIALTRKPPTDTALGWHTFDLGLPVEGSAFAGADTLIHAAWVLSGKDTGELWQQNVIGSRLLIESARAAGVSRIVFVSSMSAFFGTRQAYGLMKLAAERTVLDAGGTVVRPGLVYGDSPGGMAGTLKKVASLPVWPRFRTARMFLAHEDDIAPAVAGILDHFDDFRGHILGLANPTPYDLTTILTGLSPDHRPRRTLPVPAKAVTAPLKVIESANITLPFRSDSLLGLVEGASTLPGHETLACHGITFRAFASPDTEQCSSAG